MLYLLLLSTAYSTVQNDPVVSSFAFFGCNRLEKSDYELTKNENPSSANLPQLNRTVQDINSIDPVPNLLFVGGDMVLGYANDGGRALLSQLSGWANVMRNSKLNRNTKVIPIPGNHELNIKVGDQRLSSPSTAKLWNDWFSSEGFSQMAENGPTPQSDPDDALLNDQSRLNYSFDVGSTHYVILNTDTSTSLISGATNTPKIAWIPAFWVKRDIEKAELNPRIRSVFVFGHRNLSDPLTCIGDSPIDREAGKVLLQAMHNSSKMRAYVCAHVHAFDVRRLGGTYGPWQIIAGNGGSKLEDDWNPKSGKYFGFVTVETRKSGRVILRNYRRPVPNGKYNDSDPAPSPAVSFSTLLWDPKIRS